MATAFVSAGVYIQEKDDSLYSPALSPAIIGIVGTATKGPVNTPVLVTNEGQLIEQFGIPRTKDFGMQAAIEALKAVRLIYFVRIAGPSAIAGGITVNDSGSAATSAQLGPSTNGETFNLEPGYDIDLVVNLVPVTATFTAVAAAQESGNVEPFDFTSLGADPWPLQFRINSGPIQTVNFVAADFVDPANATVAEVCTKINSIINGGSAIATSGGTAVTIQTDRRGTAATFQVIGGSANTVLAFSTAAATGSGNVADIDAVTGLEVKSVIEAASGALQVVLGITGQITVRTVLTGTGASLRINSTSTAIGASPLINITPLDSTVFGANSGSAAPTVRFQGLYVGTYTDRITVTVSNGTITGTKKLEVKDNGVRVELFDNLFKGTTTPPTGSYDMITSVNAGAVDGSFGASTWITLLEAGPLAQNPANGTYSLTGGLNGDDWTAGTVIGTISGPTTTGMQAFANPEKIYINLLATPGISYASVISAGLDMCQLRADCMYVIDAPRGLSAQDVVSWHNGQLPTAVIVDQENRTEVNATLFNSSYGALYAPFVQMFDKYNNVNVFLPPSGPTLRTYGYTDQVADPWFAPAGPNRSQATAILDLEYSPTLGERDLMQIQGNNVNPWANIAGVGICLMGQKTLQRKPTALDRVNVRRMLLLAEKLVAQVSFFLLFEPNDPIMWRRFINLVNPIFEDIKARRGLVDFRVVADSTTNTAIVIEQSTFIGKAFLKPQKAAEKIVVPFNLIPQGANFDEFAQA